MRAATVLRSALAALVAFGLSLGSRSEAASTQLVTLVDKGPITTGLAFLPSVPTGKFRSVALFAQLSPNAFPIGLECRFTLDPVADFSSSPTVFGLSGSVRLSGFDGGGVSVLGPNLLCETACVAIPPATCTGTLTVKALFSK